MEKAPTVTTSLGSVFGKVSHVRGCDRPVFNYMGVPYAEPPVGERRFLPPGLVRPWTGDRDCTKPANPSPQNLEYTIGAFHPLKVPHDSVSEDCLYLNIHTPGVEATRGRPVMFYIHGGAYIMGMGDIHNGSALAAYGDVVVVTLNYRLGVLGFLHTRDDACSGNMGMKDQVAALQWVNQHIANFGGDPKNVTIFGLSAGAVSVQLLLLTPTSKGLFHKAITQSGSALMPNAVAPGDERERAFKLGRSLGCDSADSKTLVKFLQKVPLKELNEAEFKLCIEEEVAFLPTVDGTFLKKSPDDLYLAGDFYHVPHMLGFAENEGTLLLMGRCPKALTEEGVSEEEAMQAVRACLKVLYPKVVDIVMEVVELMYFPEDEKEKRKDPLYLATKLSEAIGHMYMTAPEYMSAELHSRFAPTYVYRHTHRPSYSIMPENMPEASHGEDVAIGWGDPFVEPSLIKMDKPYTRDEEKLSRETMKYLTNFARSGNPNGEGLFEWPQFEATSKKYLDMGLTCAVRENYEPTKMKMWNQTARKIMASMK